MPSSFTQALGADEAADSLEGPTLKATLAVKPGAEAGCSIIEGHREAGVLEQNLTFDSRTVEQTDGNGTCNANVVSGESEYESDHYVQSDIDDHCFCPQFHEVECIPTFERVHGGKIIISVLVPDRETLRDLVTRIRDNTAQVSVYGITLANGEGDGTLVLDVSDVTDKQWEAVEVALETGYYDTPRQADLGVLSERLGISKSAVSQRLKAIEAKLVRKLDEQWSGR